MANTVTSQWFGSATEDNLNELIADLQNEKMDEATFREKYPFSSGAARSRLKGKGTIIKVKGKAVQKPTTTLPPSDIDFSEVVTICPDDVVRTNVYMSESTMKRMEDALQGRKPIYRAIVLDKAVNYVLDALQQADGVILINELPSRKEKGKPGRKPKA